MNTEEQKTEQVSVNAEPVPDLPVVKQNEESITGGAFDNNHGTHVAGTIGSVGNNGVGVVS